MILHSTLHRVEKYLKRLRQVIARHHTYQLHIRGAMVRAKKDLLQIEQMLYNLQLRLNSGTVRDNVFIACKRRFDQAVLMSKRIQQHYLQLDKTYNQVSYEIAMNEKEWKRVYFFV